METTNLKDVVKEKYGQAARAVSSGAKSSCCGPKPSAASAKSSCCSGDPITSDLYDASQTSTIPEEAVLASLGCGNPVLLAQLSEGQTVLDLGSGGGIDVLLSAKRVGPAGKVYGLDMTDDMLALANENKRKAGATNVEFLRGEIESIPLPDNSVDVIISNCVINLSADKGKVLREAFRVLRPGGKFAVSDVVRKADTLPETIARNIELWIGCVAGALKDTEYEKLLAEAGFTDIGVEPTRVYRRDDATAFLQEAGIDPNSLPAEIDGAFMSAFVRATKP